MNATSTHTEPPAGYLRTADLISALSVAADLALGLPAEHSARSCYIASEIARELELPFEQKGELYYTSLLLDAGCTAWTSAFASYITGDEIIARRELFFERDSQDPFQVFEWLRHYMATDSALPVRAGRIMDFFVHGRELFREGFRNTCEVSNRFARRLGMPPAVQNALLYVFEQWDGKGMPEGAGRDSIPIVARIAHVAIYLEVSHRSHGRDGALQLASKRRGKSFDPAVVDAFVALARRPGFWELLEQETVLDAVRSLEPNVPYRYISDQKLLDVALFAADFSDIKSLYTAGHARRVAGIAERITRRMALSEREIRSVHLAALLHDLGLVAVPSFVLEKPSEVLTPAEWETLRLHPYHAERILSRVPVLEDVATIVGAHHERIDGQGYYRGLAGARIPLGARILAVADAFDELTHDGPGRAALDNEATVAYMQSEVGQRFDRDAFAALLVGEELASPAAHSAATEARRQTWPASLTTREVDVLRLAARGLTRKQMAEALFVSESTIRSHLEHIYSKIDVSTRAAATLFAVEHDLIA